MNSSGTNAVKTTAERSNLRNLVQIGMLGAVSVVLMMFEIPLFFAPSFYKIDLSEIPVLIGTFAMGPVAGMFIELIKVVLHMLFKGSSTAGVGDFANFLIGCAMIVPAGLIYQKKKSKKNFSFQGLSSIMKCVKQNKKLLKRLYREIKELLKYLAPKKVRGTFAFGTGDPSSTGLVTGLISLFPIAYQEGVYVTPDFEEKRLAADFFVKGRIRVIYFLRLFLRLYQDKELKRMWKQIHRLKKEAF